MAYIKEYWQNKEQRAETARKHTKEMQNKYGRCIQTAISATKIYDTDLIGILKRISKTKIPRLL